MKGPEVQIKRPSKMHTLTQGYQTDCSNVCLNLKEDDMRQTTTQTHLVIDTVKLASWLSFVISNCDVVTFTLVSWVRCGA